MTNVNLRLARIGSNPSKVTSGRQKGKAMCRPFTISDSVAIEVVMHALEGKAKVRRWISETGTVAEGTARHLVTSPDNFGFYDPHADVRDAYLRVTLVSGFDVAWLVSDLMKDALNGEFAEEI